MQSLSTSHIYMDKVKRCVHLSDKSMFFPLCIFKELLKSNALTNFQEIWTDKFKIFLAFLGGRGGGQCIYFLKNPTFRSCDYLINVLTIHCTIFSARTLQKRYTYIVEKNILVLCLKYQFYKWVVKKGQTEFTVICVFFVQNLTK